MKTKQKAIAAGAWFQLLLAGLFPEPLGFTQDFWASALKLCTFNMHSKFKSVRIQYSNIWFLHPPVFNHKLN